MANWKVTSIHLIIIASFLMLLAACTGKNGNDNYAADNEEDSGKQYQSENVKDSMSSHEVAKADTLPLQKYKYTWTDSKDMPPVVIIVDDFGNSGALLEDYAKLPSQVVFAVLPDLAFTKKAGEIASQNGHEVIIHIPMQPESTKENPGERFIKTSSSDSEINDLLNAFKAQLPMAIGGNNHMGSAVTANRNCMLAIHKDLHDKGLFFVDSATSAKSLSMSIAETLGYPPLRRDIFLDVPDNTDATLANKISSLGKFKGRKEPVIIITHCHTRSKLDALQKFITQIQGMGIKLTTLSAARNISV